MHATCLNYKWAGNVSSGRCYLAPGRAATLATASPATTLSLRHCLHLIAADTLKHSRTRFMANECKWCHSMNNFDCQLQQNVVQYWKRTCHAPNQQPCPPVQLPFHSMFHSREPPLTYSIARKCCCGIICQLCVLISELANLDFSY